jgi:predicted HTH domain antitoxin
MEQPLLIQYPKSLATFLKMKDREFINEMKIISIVKLYELGKISSGYASGILGLSRVAFVEMLHKYNVSYFANVIEDEIENDLTNA